MAQSSQAIRSYLAALGHTNLANNYLELFCRKSQILSSKAQLNGRCHERCVQVSLVKQMAVVSCMVVH